MSRRMTGRQGVTFYMKDDTFSALKIFASTNKRSVNEIVNQAFDAWWASHPDRAEFEKLARRAARTIKPEEVPDESGN